MSKSALIFGMSLTPIVVMAGTFQVVSYSGITTYAGDPNGNFFGRMTTYSAIGSSLQIDFQASISIDTVEGGASDQSYRYRTAATHSVTATIEWLPSYPGEPVPEAVTVLGKSRYKYGISTNVAANHEFQNGLSSFWSGGQVLSGSANVFPGHITSLSYTTPSDYGSTPSSAASAFSGDPFGQNAWNLGVGFSSRKVAIRREGDRYVGRVIWSLLDEFRGTPVVRTDPTDRAEIALLGTANGWLIGELRGRVLTQVRVSSIDATPVPGW